MLYCKNCGKKLPDDARFCDRCNTSVRQKGSKKELIENLKEERLARRKAKVVEERLKNIKKIKHRRIKVVVRIIIGFVILGIVSGVVTYIIGSRNSITDAIETAPQEIEEPEGTPTPTAVVIGDGIQAPTVNSDGYMVIKLGDVSFAYPSSFAASEDSTSTSLSLSDNTGGANIVALYQPTTADATTQMKACVSESGIAVDDAKVNGNYYLVTGTYGDNTYHRFGVVENGKEVCYDFIYPTNSAAASKYAEYIEYMDGYIKSQ